MPRKKHKSINGLVNLFGTDFDSLFDAIASGEETSTFGAEKENYVDLGIRLMTMAREAVHEVHFTDLEEKIFSLDYSGVRKHTYAFSNEGTDFYRLLYLIATKVIRPLLRKSTSFDSEEMKLLHELISGYGWNIYTYNEIIEAEPEAAKLIFRSNGLRLNDIFSRNKRKYQSGEEILYLTLAEKGDALYVGAKMESFSSVLQSNRVFTHYRNVKVCDIGLLLAELFVVDFVRKKLLDDDFIKSSAYDDAIAERYFGALSYKSHGVAERSIPYFTNRKKLKGATILSMGSTSKDTPFFEKCMKETGNAFIFGRNNIVDFLVERYPSQQGELLLSSGLNFNDFAITVHELIHKDPRIDHPIIMDDKMLWIYLFANAEWKPEYFDGFFSRYWLFREGNPPEVAMADLFSNCNESVLITNLFLACVSVASHQVAEVREIRKQLGNVAKAFQTKKNIPLKIVSEMEKNCLNTRFGYIEFDEQCDLKAINTVTHQILHFTDTYFPNQDIKPVSLRFRRIGNHKAYGLYYMFYKCICIDIHSPGSFVHEFGHMMDYCNGHLSDSMYHREFKSLYSTYRRLVSDIVDKDKDLRAKLGGSSKYNFEYYMNPSEVFARCFELFMFYHMKLDNSLIKDMSSKDLFAYPSDESFLMQVKGYFSSLDCMKDALEQLPKVEEEKKEKEMIL